MSMFAIIALCGVVLLLAYFTYGRLLVRWLRVQPDRVTPAVQYDDGNDFVPAPSGVVLGGHFTAIAAAGPVVGPIVAGLMFGWGPALLWIVLGAILIGGVHDAGSLLASIRHRATSITQVVRQHMSRAAYLLFLVFVWFALVYVVIAFVDVTAGSFAFLQKFDVKVGQGTQGAGVAQSFAVNGGSVAVGAAAYLAFSIVMGLVLRFTQVAWYAALPVAVVGLGLCIWTAPGIAEWIAGQGLALFDASLGDAAERARHWGLGILIYCFIASIVPMWLLLQPRGIIGASFLYATLAFGVVGVLVGTMTGDASLSITYPAFKGFVAESGAMLFPILFITIACGACSGFHSIVASGTTCKQLRSERDVKPVAYGAMLLEAMVAVFALSCVMVMMPGETGKADAVYARGIGNFMRIVGIDMQFAVMFALLAFSSFVFDTLDVCTRLGRYVLQELAGVPGMAAGAAATLATVALPALYLYVMPPNSFITFWTLFGTSNQLLAALTLVGVSVWLWRTGRPVWFALLPAVFMLVTTAAALVVNIRGFWAALEKTGDAAVRLPLMVNLSIASLLLGLSAFVVFEAVRVWFVSRSGGGQESGGAAVEGAGGG